MRLAAVVLVMSSALFLVLHPAEGGGPAPAQKPAPGSGLAQPWLVPPFFARFAEPGDRHLSRLEITSVTADSPAERAGLMVGDRVLAVGGYRIHDTAELKLIAGLIPVDHDAECWAVLRQDEVLTVTMRDILCSGARGVAIGVAAQDLDMVHAVEACGLTIAAADRDEVNRVPTRAVHALQDWLAGQPAGKRDVAWLGSFIDTYVKVLRCQEVAAPVQAIPVPYLAQLERFYRAIAAERAAGDQDPDLARLGCDRAFFALSYPWPAAPSPDLGKFTTSDARWLAFFRRVLSDPAITWAERKRFAWTCYRSDADDDVTRFINAIKGSLVEEGIPDEDDPSPYQEGGHHGHTCAANYLHSGAAGRTAFIDDLRRQYRANGPDVLLMGYGLSGALLVDDKVDEAFAVMERLFKDSPYFGWRATLEAPRAMQWALGEVDAPYEQNLQRLDAFIAKHPVCPVPRYVRAYTYTLDRSWYLQIMNQISDYNSLSGRPTIWRANGELVFAALDPDWEVIEEVRKAEDKMAIAFIDIVDASACDARVRDGGDALLAVDMEIGAIKHVTPGVHLRMFHYQAELAAALAMGGDYERACAWQDRHVEQWKRMRPDDPIRIHQLSAQRLYHAHRPPEPRHEVRAKPFTLRYPDGKLKIAGGMVGDQAEGRWCFYHPSGELCASGSYLEGVRTGIWRRFAEDGTRIVEGAFSADHRIGRWRAWRADGTLLSVGCYGGPGQDGRLGRWSWFHQDGRIQATGLFLRGSQEGRWLVWDTADTVIGDASFARGTPLGAWPAGATAAEPPSPLPPWQDLPDALKTDAAGAGPRDQQHKATGANDF